MGSGSENSDKGALTSITLRKTASYYMILHMSQALFQVTFQRLEFHAPTGTLEMETMVLALHLLHGVPKNLNRFTFLGMKVLQD